MTSLHTTVAATAWSRTNQQEQAASATLPVGYSAFICVETPEINSSGSIFSIERVTSDKTSLSLREALENLQQLLISDSLFWLFCPASIYQIMFWCLCFIEQSTRRFAAGLVWESAALQSCTIRSVQPRAFFTGHMTKSVRHKGRVTNAKKKERRDFTTYRE